MLPESVERRDTIQQTWNPDIWKSTDEKQLQVINNKMMHSESNSIYLKAMSTRKTFGIEIFSENSYEYSKRRKFIWKTLFFEELLQLSFIINIILNICFCFHIRQGSTVRTTESWARMQPELRCNRLLRFAPEIWIVRFRPYSYDPSNKPMVIDFNGCDLTNMIHTIWIT